jgi:hypothetical protein
MVALALQSVLRTTAVGDRERRRQWALRRRDAETRRWRTRSYGGGGPVSWWTFRAAEWALARALEVAGRFEDGVKNAHRLALRTVEHRFANLPIGFDGFSILQLSDLHIDGSPPLVRAVIDTIGDLQVDLCAITGDYREAQEGPFDPVDNGMAEIVSAVSARHGAIGVLGNHDDAAMVEPLEAIGLRLLINETLTLRRGADRIAVVGTDDVHDFYTPAADRALRAVRDEPFSVALVHSPEIYDVAERAGVDLYLCGHTHGGQVCLPGGRPLVTHLRRGRRLYRGLWRHGRMRGYTHVGTGTSGVPVRFNTRGEVVIHRLRRDSSGGQGHAAARRR